MLFDFKMENNSCKIYCATKTLTDGKLVTWSHFGVILFHSQIEQHSQSGCRTEGYQQRPGLQSSAVKAWTPRFRCGQRPLPVGVG